MMANSRARAQDDADGLVKFIADAATDKILGAHIMSANAGELIHEVRMPVFSIYQGFMLTDWKIRSTLYMPFPASAKNPIQVSSRHVQHPFFMRLLVPGLMTGDRMAP